jgi:hypothetical protein
MPVIEPPSLHSARFRASFLVGCAVIKTQTATIFTVAPTAYGWCVTSGAQRLALFVTQQQAVNHVRKCRAELKAKCLKSEVVVRSE